MRLFLARVLIALLPFATPLIVAAQSLPQISGAGTVRPLVSADAARGWEAVSYVQNIRNFHTIIAWNEKEKLQQIATRELSEEDFAQFSPVMTEAVKSVTVSAL